MSTAHAHDPSGSGADAPFPDTGPATPLDPAYLRRVRHLDELAAAGPPGADRRWVHEAHAAAMRHLASARMRR